MLAAFSPQCISVSKMLKNKKIKMLIDCNCSVKFLEQGTSSSAQSDPELK